MEEKHQIHRESMGSSTCRNGELISLIWLDNMAHLTDQNRQIQHQLRSLVNSLQIFDNCQQCEDFIRHRIDEKILLIVSGQLGQQIIERVHHLKQIVSIIVFCFDKDKHQRWAKQFTKVGFHLKQERYFYLFR